MERAALASIISNPTWQQIDSEGRIDDWLALAKAEGVVALTSQALCRDAAADALRAQFAAAAHELAATHLLLESECRRVVEILHAAGIPVLVLKGTALGRWLYPAAYLRECSDIDLLFPSRAHAEQAAAALTAIGYGAVFTPGGMAHEFLCRREAPGKRVDLDLHWRLANMPLLRDLISFAELQAASIPLLLAPGARGLGPVHAFAHACIHRAENVCAKLGDRLKWLYDLHLLAGRFTAAEWQSLLRLCVGHGLCGICVEGIDASAAMFDTCVPPATLAALRAGRAGETLDASRLADWNYMQRCNLAALPSLRARVSWLWQRAFPSSAYLRELYGGDAGVVTLWRERIGRAIGRLVN